MDNDIICKKCACFEPNEDFVNGVSDVVGVCSIGDYYLPIHVSEEIIGCCLFESYEGKDDKS